MLTPVGFFACAITIGGMFSLCGLLVLQVILSLAKYNGRHGVNPLPLGPNL
jgi:hypothetical protein